MEQWEREGVKEGLAKHQWRSRPISMATVFHSPTAHVKAENTCSVGTYTHTNTHTRTLPPWIPLTSSHPHMVTVERKLLHQCKQKQEKPCLALLLLIKSNWYDSSVLIFSLVLTFMYSHWHEQTLTRPDPLLHDSFKPNWYIYIDIYLSARLLIKMK